MTIRSSYKAIFKTSSMFFHGYKNREDKKNRKIILRTFHLVATIILFYLKITYDSRNVVI